MGMFVSFIKTDGIGGVIAAPSLSLCRVTETVALNGTTTATAEIGETILITNTGSDAVLATHGNAPDASATTATSATSAGYVVPSGQTIVIAPETGQKVNVKAIA
jgi:hypothetical protein